MIHRISFTSGNDTKMMCSVGDLDAEFGKCTSIDTTDNKDKTFDVIITMEKETEDGIQTYQSFHPCSKLDFIIR